MKNLNQQIAEELGWFIATEEATWIIWIHLCTPDGSIAASWTLPIDPYFWEEYWKDFETRFGSRNIEDNPLYGLSMPDWENDLALALTLCDYPLPVPGERQSIIWNISKEWTATDKKPQLYINAFCGHINGFGYAESIDNPAEAFSKAWLSMYRDIKKYWAGHSEAWWDHHKE
jgi:hypothetical protein